MKVGIIIDNPIRDFDWALLNALEIVNNSNWGLFDNNVFSISWDQNNRVRFINC